jgi:hypothetical protein
MSEDVEELIDLDLKEETCRAIAGMINKVMKMVIDDYRAEANISFMKDLEVLMKLVDSFKNYCLMVIEEEK